MNSSNERPSIKNTACIDFEESYKSLQDTKCCAYNECEQELQLLDPAEKPSFINHKVQIKSDDIDAILGPENDTWAYIKWFQPLAHPITYLAAISYISLTSGFFFYYYTSSITTVERRYGLSSKITGVVSTGNDIVCIIFSIPLGYVAGRGHRPRWLVIGVAMAVLACLLCVLPHFISGPGEYARDKFFASNNNNADVANTLHKDLCNINTINTQNSTCSEDDTVDTTTEQQTIIILQFIAQMLAGVCNIQLYVAGYSYLDDAVSKENFPIYLGTAGMLRVFGPVVAMMISSWSLNKWIDPSITPNITPKHPNWVGAWWLGYLVIGAAIFSSMFPMLLMPKMLPATRRRLTKRLQAAAEAGEESFRKIAQSLRPQDRLNIKDILTTFRNLIRNRVYCLLSVNQLVIAMGVVIFYMYVNKYMEHQFQLSASEANKYLGVVGMFATFFGWLLGGSIMTFGRPKPRNAVIITVSISAGLILQFLLLMTFTCQRPDVVGLDMEMKSTDKGISSELSSSNAMTSCMSSCNCDVTYSPVCVTVLKNKSISPDIIDEDDQSHQRRVSFFSLCHAGCTTHASTNHSDVNNYTNCICAKHLLNQGEQVISVKAGECPRQCPSLYPFLVLKTSIGVFLSANRMITYSFFFRSLDERDKDLGLAVLNILVCIGLIIGPIICGQAIDWTCKLWEMSCGSQKSCKLYNIEAFRYILFITPAVSFTFGMILEMMMFFYTDKMVLYDDVQANVAKNAFKKIKNRFARKSNK